MGCVCGGFSSRVKLAHGDALLTFERCGCCGRCARWRLTSGGTKMAGTGALLEFRRLSGCQRCDGAGIEAPAVVAPS